MKKNCPVGRKAASPYRTQNRNPSEVSADRAHRACRNDTGQRPGPLAKVMKAMFQMKKLLDWSRPTTRDERAVAVRSHSAEQLSGEMNYN
jgi:hypothetical protein